MMNYVSKFYEIYFFKERIHINNIMIPQNNLKQFSHAKGKGI